MSDEIVEVKAAGGAVAMPQDVMAMLAQHAKDAAAKERPATSMISLRAGVLSYGGTPVPNNKLEVIVVAAAFRNVWYAGKFDPNNIVNPNCFALSLDESGMVPDEVVAQKPHTSCAGCPKNEWGSDPGGGRGKACKQSRRLVMLPADCATKPEADVMTAEFAKMDIPVTSVKNYSSYVNAVAASTNRPTFAIVTEISTSPDVKTQFKVNFKPMRLIDNMESLTAIMKRIDSAQALALEPYEETAVLELDPDGNVKEPVPVSAPAGKRKY
jgi:hypothetical protein